MDIFKLNSVIMVLYRAFHFLHQLSWHGMREMVKERCFFVFVKEETERGKTSLVRRKNALQGVTTLLVLIMVPNSIINIDG